MQLWFLNDIPDLIHTFFDCHRYRFLEPKLPFLSHESTSFLGGQAFGICISLEQINSLASDPLGALS